MYITAKAKWKISRTGRGLLRVQKNVSIVSWPTEAMSLSATSSMLKIMYNFNNSWPRIV